MVNVIKLNKQGVLFCIQTSIFQSIICMLIACLGDLIFANQLHSQNGKKNEKYQFDYTEMKRRLYS